VVGLVLPVVLLTVGAGLLTAGAEAFAENVTAASARLGVSVLALGLLLAGAEPEEAVTAMLASGQGHPALAGDAVGANLVILTLTLGLAGLVTRLPVSRRSLEYGVAAAVLGAVAWLFLLNGVLARAEGLLLVLAYVGGVVWVWRREQEPPVIGEMAELGGPAEARDPGSATDEATGRSLLVVLLGVLGMVAGGALAVRGAEGLVDVLEVGESVIGLTLLALATSAEMVALVWASRRRGLTDVVVAGTVGAVAYNATVSLGLAGLVSPLGLGRHNVVISVAGLTAVLPLVLLFARRSGVLPRTLAAVLVLGYVAVTAWLFAR
jgi:cation:H+ antiporter